jgi:hypothetical protein
MAKKSKKRDAVHKMVEKSQLQAGSARRKIRKNVIPVVISGFAFVVALVWRDFIRDVVELMVERTGIENTYIYSFVVAVLVTVVALIVVFIITKDPKKLEKTE